jgi:hypothetical protein
MRACPRFLVALLAPILLFGSSTRAAAESVATFSDSIILPGGPCTTNGGTTLVDYFFNIERSNYGNFSSFAVADFAGLHLAINSLTQLAQFSVALTEDNAAFSAPGTYGIYLSTETTTNIGLGSPLRFQSSQLPQDLGTQLNGAINNPLGTFFFAQTGSVGSGTIDTINLLPGALALSSSVQSFLVNQLTDGGTIRLVAASKDSGVTATYAGIGDFNFPNGAPTLAASAVPEPTGLAIGCLALGLIECAQRRLYGRAA